MDVNPSWTTSRRMIAKLCGIQTSGIIFGAFAIFLAGCATEAGTSVPSTQTLAAVAELPTLPPNTPLSVEATATAANETPTPAPEITATQSDAPAITSLPSPTPIGAEEAAPTETLPATATMTFPPPPPPLPTPSHTPLPTPPSGLSILQFMVEPTNAKPGDTVILSWQTANADSATLLILQPRRQEIEIPVNGTFQDRLPADADFNQGYHLLIEDADGKVAYEQLLVSVECANKWFFAPAPTDVVYCPQPAESTQIVETITDNGRDIYVAVWDKTFSLANQPYRYPPFFDLDSQDGQSAPSDGGSVSYQGLAQRNEEEVTFVQAASGNVWRFDQLNWSKQRTTVGTPDAAVGFFTVSPENGDLGDLATIAWRTNAPQNIYIEVRYKAAWNAVDAVYSPIRDLLVVPASGEVEYQIPSGVARKEIEFWLQADRGITLAKTMFTPTCPFPSQDCRFSSNASYQLFENGFMIYVEALNQIIYSDLDGLEHAFVEDRFVPGQDGVPDPALTPPPGTTQPTGRFGKLWRENETVRELLGWAVLPERTGVYHHDIDPFSRYGYGESFYIEEAIHVDIFNPNPTWVVEVNVDLPTLPATATPQSQSTGCAIRWFFQPPPADGACPTSAPLASEGAIQYFQSGYMIWIEALDEIWYADYGNIRQQAIDNYVHGVDPISDPNLVPPSGMFQPDYGFGKIWRELGLQNSLGWAVAQPINGTIQIQGSENQQQEYIELPDGSLLAVDYGSGVWRFIAPNN